MSNQNNLTLAVSHELFLRFVKSFGNGFFKRTEILQHDARQYQSLFGAYMTWYPSTGTISCSGKPNAKYRLSKTVNEKYELFVKEIHM